MARKPSFDFERRERAKGKALKRTEKARAKADKKSTAVEADADEDQPVEERPAESDATSHTQMRSLMGTAWVGRAEDEIEMGSWIWKTND